MISTGEKMLGKMAEARCRGCVRKVRNHLPVTGGLRTGKPECVDWPDSFPKYFLPSVFDFSRTHLINPSPQYYNYIC